MMDPSVHPEGDNFYLYANGGYVARTQLPADRATASASSAISPDRSFEQVAAIILRCAAKSNAPAGSNERKIADLYRSYMDEAAIESHVVRASVDSDSLKTPPRLHRDSSTPSTSSLNALGLTLPAPTSTPSISPTSTPTISSASGSLPSFNDPDHYAPYLLQRGIELPDRDYYLSTSDSMKEIRTKYLLHVSAMFRLAEPLQTPESLRHQRRRAQNLQLRSSKSLSLTAKTSIKPTTPGCPSDFQRQSSRSRSGRSSSAPPDSTSSRPSSSPAALQLSPGEARARSLAAHRRMERSPRLSPHRAIRLHRHHLQGPCRGANLLFFGTTCSPEQQRCAHATSAPTSSSPTRLATPSARIYAQRFFSPEAKARARKAIVANLLVAFRSRLENLTWMAPATKKAEAIAKLGTLKVGIGYPRPLAQLRRPEHRNPDNLFAEPFERRPLRIPSSLLWRQACIGQPTDRKEWCMTPQTVNAVNLPLFDNGLPTSPWPPSCSHPSVIPLVPPPTTTGAIGTIIGHEISCHTFDSEGAAFDSKGRVRNWWGSLEDLAHFKAVTAALAAQYDTYTPFPDVHVNGFVRPSAKTSPT